MITLKIFSILCLGLTTSSPIDEFGSSVYDGDITQDDVPQEISSKLIPGRYMGSPSKIDSVDHSLLTPEGSSRFDVDDISTIFELNDQDSEAFLKLKELMDKGYTKKGLTFNIYDDNMRKAAISLFRLLQNLDDHDIHKVTEWAREVLNQDLVEYAQRLASLYSNKYNHKEKIPRYITKPNFFINRETIIKAAKLKATNGEFKSSDAKVNQFYRADDVITINTNYSGWNAPVHTCEAELNYFREDIGLNNYYYGVHLMHPFWMSNGELDEFNPRHAEHYYYIHQQLLARYGLEKEHLKFDYNKSSKNCRNIYDPYLIYDNGLPFPTRYEYNEEWSEDRAYLKTIEIALEECISRGLIVMINGTALNMTDENHTDVLAKLIRANLDGVKAAKIIRSLYGYGVNTTVGEMYKSSPSVLHHAETSLRDPMYWDLINKMLGYFINFKNSLEPFSLKQYETSDFKILEADIPDITTLYAYYEFDIDAAIKSDETHNDILSPLIFTAKQRRLAHSAFNFEFLISSQKDIPVVVRLFLGPKCEGEKYWEEYSKFLELDSFNYDLVEGLNTVSWSPKQSSRFSFDEYYNFGTKIKHENKYNMFKFPQSLLIPKGHEDGLNLTFFVMVTPAESVVQSEKVPESNYYHKVINELDNKPLGFPFHRKATDYNNKADSYRFFDINIYHKKLSTDKSGFFSSNLY